MKYIKYLLITISCLFSFSIFGVSASADMLEPYTNETSMQYQVFVPLYSAPCNRLHNNVVRALDGDDVADIVTSLIAEQYFEQTGMEIPVDVVETIYHSFQYAEGDKTALPEIVSDVIVLIDDLYVNSDIPEPLVDYIVDTAFERFGYYQLFEVGLSIGTENTITIFEGIMKMIYENPYLLVLVAISLLISAFSLMKTGKRSVR